MGRTDFSTSKHNISCTTNGSRYHSIFEAKYRSLAIRELILALKKKEAIPKFSILSVMYVLKKAWDAISNQTFTNCLRKLGSSKKDAEKEVDDEEG